MLKDGFLLVLERDGMKIFSMMGIFVKHVPSLYRSWQDSSERLSVTVIDNFVYTSASGHGIDGQKLL